MRNYRPFPRAMTLLEVVLVVATIAFLAWISVPNFIISCGGSPVSRARNDMRSMATAIEAYRIDHDAYPAMRPLSESTSDPRSLARADGSALMAVQPGDPVRGIEGLTTPVAYLGALPADPFSPEGTLPFAYFGRGESWILISAGPDRDYDIDPFRHFKPDEFATSDDSLILNEHVLQHTYDPTNGLESSGDIIRIHAGELYYH